MTIEITATEQITRIEGLPARVWNGVTKDGAKCLVFVNCIAVPPGEPQAEFEANLQKQLPPARPVDLRQIL